MKKNRQAIHDAFNGVMDVREQQFVLVGNLSEAKFDADKRTAEVTVIRKGWSKNGFYYGDKALESIAMFLNSTAEEVFLNHNKRSEIFEPRIAEDHIGNNVVASVSSDGLTVVAKAKFFESGPKAWSFDRMRETPQTFGPSIVGKAKIRQGMAEGRRGPIVEDVTYLHSYDMVVKPAAGGKVNSVSESLCPTEEGCGFVHVFEGLVSDEDQDFLLEALDQLEDGKITEEDVEEAEEAASTKLKDRLKQKKDRQEAVDRWYDLEWTFTSEASDLVLARGDYEFIGTPERKKLVAPLITEFSTEMSKIKFVAPRPMPKVTGDQVAEAEVEVEESQIKITLHGPGVFEKNTFRKVTVSKENGITMTVGKLKKGKRKSEARSYQFDTDKGWTEALAKKWLAKNVKSKSTTNTKEGVDQMYKNLAELKAENPALYERLIAEAKNDQHAQEQIEQWKTDSDKFTTVNESLSTMTGERDTLKGEKDTLEAENKTLKEANDKYAAALSTARKSELITEVKTEVGLADEFCSDAFNSVLEGIEFNSEKEDEFKAAIKEHVEDRKSLVENKVPVKLKKKIVEGAGHTETETATEQSAIRGNEDFAAAMKS